MTVEHSHLLEPLLLLYQFPEILYLQDLRRILAFSEALLEELLLHVQLLPELVPNTFQEDCDGDVEGDACEASWDDRDDDGDGVCNGPDNCPANANSGQADGDGVADCLDNCPAVANPVQADSNGDGVGDACPLANLPVGACGCGATSTVLMGLWALWAMKQARRRVRCALRL